MTQINQEQTPHERHVQEWKASAITDDLMHRNFRTYTDPRDVDELLNYKTNARWQHSEQLVPGWGVSGVDPKTGERWLQGVQYKPDIPLPTKIGKPRKYLSPYRQSLSPLFLETDDADYWPKLIKDVGHPILITEGAKKAAAAIAHGFPSISLPGVSTGGLKARLRASLALFCCYGRPLYLAFDRDIVEKPQVARALHNLGRMVAERGAMVYILEWPQKHKGLDDWIAAGGDIQPLIDEARTLEEWRDSLDNENVEEGFKCALARKYELIEAKLADRIRWNDLRSYIEIDGEPCEPDELRLELARKFNISVGQGDCEVILKHLSKRNTYRPIPEYLLSCAQQYAPDPELLDSICSRWLRVNSELYRTYMRKTLIAAVARAFNPGCKVDTVCIIKGKQGTRKSTFWQTLASSEWFDDSFGNVSDKDEKLKLHQCWFEEWAELDVIFKRKDVSDVKRFITTSIDPIRKPYARTVEQCPRPSIIVGSTNESAFLTDPTGSRRFWIIPLPNEVTRANPIDTDSLGEERDRIWAAAVHAYQSGESWDLPLHLIEQSSEENLAYAVSDPWLDLVEDYVADKPYVTAAEILSKCIKVDPERQTKALEMRVATLLLKLGMASQRCRREGKRRVFWFHTNKVGTVGTSNTIDTQSIDIQGNLLDSSPDHTPDHTPRHTRPDLDENQPKLSHSDCDSQDVHTSPHFFGKKPENSKSTKKSTKIGQLKLVTPYEF